MSLGEQDAANVLKQLDAREVQKLGIAMAELKEVSREQMTAVLDKFIGVADAKANIAGGSQDYVRRVLTQAVGKQKTDMLLDRVVERPDRPGHRGAEMDGIQGRRANHQRRASADRRHRARAPRAGAVGRDPAAAHRGDAHRSADAHRHR